MKVNHFTDAPSQAVEMPGATGCTVRWLLGPQEGAPNFSLRRFEVEPGGFTPKHQHPYEHEVFVLEGTGVVLEGDIEHPLVPGGVIYVAPNDLHQFKNTGTTPLKFLCMIPNSAMAQSQATASVCGATR